MERYSCIENLLHGWRSRFGKEKAALRNSIETCPSNEWTLTFFFFFSVLISPHSRFRVIGEKDWLPQLGSWAHPIAKGEKGILIYIPINTTHNGEEKMSKIDMGVSLSNKRNAMRLKTHKCPLQWMKKGRKEWTFLEHLYIPSKYCVNYFTQVSISSWAILERWAFYLHFMGRWDGQMRKLRFREVKGIAEHRLSNKPLEWRFGPRFTWYLHYTVCPKLK